MSFRLWAPVERLVKPSAFLAAGKRANGILKSLQMFSTSVQAIRKGIALAGLERLPGGAGL